MLTDSFAKSCKFGLDYLFRDVNVKKLVHIDEHARWRVKI